MNQPKQNQCQCPKTSCGCPSAASKVSARCACGENCSCQPICGCNGCGCNQGK